MKRARGGSELLLSASEISRLKKRFRRRARARTQQGAFRRGFDRRNIGFFGRTGPLATNPELKFHDVASLTVLPVPTGGIVRSSIVQIAQGITETTRIGRKCVIHNVAYRFTITIPSTADPTQTNDVVRIIIYQDKQTNGTGAIPTDILRTAAYRSFNNLSNKGRFRTLMDRFYDLNCAAGVDGFFGDTSVTDSIFKKLNIPMEFESSPGTLSTIKSNNIGILFISLNGLCNILSSTRVRFSDQ